MPFLIAVAYVGRETQKVHVKTYDVLDNGELNFKHHEDVGVKSKRNTGPALAYGMNTLVLASLKKNN